MSERKIIKVRLEDGTIHDYEIEYATCHPWSLAIFGLDTESERFDSDDLFSCLIKLRQRLEQRNCKLLCNGARIDVFPSAMMREMGGGRMAYRNRIGKYSEREDIVDIFNYAAPETVGSIDEQKRFHEQWIYSLKK